MSCSRSTPFFAPLLAAATLVASGCGSDSPTAPAPLPVVTLTVSEVRGPYFGEDDEGPIIRCDITLRATARGTGVAEWGDAKVRYFAGADRTKPVDSVSVSASEIRESWGGRAISEDRPLQSGWTFSGRLPFAVQFEYHYGATLSGAMSKSATASFRCGPDVPANTQPPTVRLTLPTPDGALEPGDAITVGVDAESPVGLWQTVVVLSGPCELQQAFNERAQTTVTHTVTFVLPASCLLGVPLRVSAFALDIAARDGGASTLTTIALVDETRPVVNPMFVGGGGPFNPTISGTFFAGDSVELTYSVWDNARLAVVYWELVTNSGTRTDSVLLSASTYSEHMFIRFPVDETGDVQIRFFARDAAGFTSDTVATTPGTLHLRRTILRPTITAEVDGEVRDALFDPVRGRLYVLQGRQRRIEILTTALARVGTVALPNEGSARDLSPSGDSLLVVLPQGSRLAIVDLRQPSPTVETLSVYGSEPDLGAQYIAAAANRKIFIGSPATQKIVEFDLLAGSHRTRDEAAYSYSYNGPELVASHDHAAFVWNGIQGQFQRYDSASDTFSPARAISTWARTPSIDAHGSRVAAGLEIYDESLQLVRTLTSIFSLFDIPVTALSPGGEYLYCVHPRFGIVRSRISDGELMDRTPNTVQPSFLRASPDGIFLLGVEAMTAGRTKLSIMDLR